MYKISDLVEDYRSLQVDYTLLQAVYKKMKEAHLETGDIEDLMHHNRQYSQRLVSLLQDDFPVMATDVDGWSETMWKNWLDFLLEYPEFWQGKQEVLIGLFWSLDNRRKLWSGDKVALLCAHNNMVDFAADTRNKSAVTMLNFLIQKYATLSKAEQFQNEVDLKISNLG